MMHGTVLGLIDLVYSCSNEKTSWLACLEAFGRACNAPVVRLATRTFSCSTDGHRRQPGQAYHLCVHRSHRWQSHAEPEIEISEQIVPAGTPRPEQRTPADLLLQISLERCEASEPFGEPERELIRLLLPHLLRAVDFYERLTNVQVRGWILDSLTLPLMLVGRNSDLLWANSAANRLLREGLALYLDGGRLQARLAAENARLRRMLGEAARVSGAAGSGRWVQLKSADRYSEVPIFLTQVPSAIQGGMTAMGRHSGASLIFVGANGLEKTQIPGRLRRVWGLTEAEAQLASELLDGAGLRVAASRLNVSINTAKSQLGSVFRKSASSRQSELIPKMLLLALLSELPNAEPVR